ncbi:MAG TPA: hypothetical protein VKN18_16670, partial [Blastocatellia bacterium]|nr:hypothetical protein [Blastocatellia bacterium]
VNLENHPSGLKGYLDRWWKEVSRAVSEAAVSDLLGYLLVAYGRLTRDDLTDISQEDVLSGAVFERTIEQVQRYVVGDEKYGYTFCHARFRDYIAQERIKEAEQLPYRKRLLEYCKRWAGRHSDYAMQYLVAHLADSDNHEALWKVLTEEDQDGRNVWYEAHVAARDSQIDASDRLRWYIRDIERAKEIFYSPAQPLPRSFGLALLWASVNSISDRAPMELFAIMASLGEGMARRAITLARHKVSALKRARALVSIVTNLADPAVRNDLAIETLNAIDACQSQWGRSSEFVELAPVLSSEHSRVALDILLRSPEYLLDVEAAATLASKLPDSEAAQVYSALKAALRKVDDPINRAELFVALSQIDFPLAHEAVREAHELIGAVIRDWDLQDRSHPTLLGALAEHPRLLAAIVEVSGRAAIPGDEILQALGGFEPQRQADILAKLLREPEVVPIIPAVNHLLTLESSEERANALAEAIDLLDEENIRRLVFGVNWDFKELSWVVPHLSEPLRSECARNLLEYVMQESPQFHIQVEILARIIPFLTKTDRERALEYMEACAQKVPLVPPEEELARQAVSMLRISDPSGKSVPFEWSASPSRADTLAILARVAEGERKRDYIERSLQAARAIGDPYEASVFLVELSKSCRDEERLSLQVAALDLAKNIEWESTRAEAIEKIAPFLGPQATEAAMGILASFSIEKVGEIAAAQLLVNRTPLSDQDRGRIITALEDEDKADYEDHYRSVSLVERLADKIDQMQIDGLVDRVLKWSDADAAKAIGALTHRLSAERALALLTSRSWPLDVIERLLQSLPTSERDEAAPWVYNSIINHPNAAVRASALAMLDRLDVSSLNNNELHKRLEEALEQIDLKASPKEFSFVAKELPATSPYRVKLVTAALDGKGALDRLEDWGTIVHHLAGAAAPAALLELLSSLEPLDVRDRIVGLRTLSKRIADELPAHRQWDAWKEILRFTSRDSRRDLLAQLRSALPLIERLTPEPLIGAIADEVLRVYQSFP